MGLHGFLEKPSCSPYVLVHDASWLIGHAKYVDFKQGVAMDGNNINSVMDMFMKKEKETNNLSPCLRKTVRSSRYLEEPAITVWGMGIR